MSSFNLLRSLLVVGFYFHGVRSLPVDPEPSFAGFDCSQVWEKNNSSVSGIYTIKPNGADKPFQVFCEMSTSGGRTVIQKHNGDNSLAFDKIWNDYKDGFGNLTGEHWLGLDKMYLLTNQPCRCAMLNISLGAFSGELAYAYYDSFSVGHVNISFKISLGKYIGSAGDAFRGVDAKDMDNNVEGSLFSTQDKDNDNCSPCLRGDILFSSCARDFGSGWWFNKCAVSNLNGKWRPQSTSVGWRSAVSWKKWKDNESLKFSVMYVINQ